MTGSHPDDDEQSLVIHVDASSVFDLESPDLEPEYEPFLQRYRAWLIGFLVLAVLTGIGYVIGNATYDPPSRLPVLAFDTTDPLYGNNASVEVELNILRETFAGTSALQLAPGPTVFEIPLPRTVADRLFGERDEAITIFTAIGDDGVEHRFLVLSGDDGRRIYAAEAPLGLSSSLEPFGVFVALDRADPTLGVLVAALDSLLPAVRDVAATKLDAGDIYVFGPYAGGDSASLGSRVAQVDSMRHLTHAIRASDGDVSMTAPLFLISSGPQRGTINAIYHPARRAIMEPLWGDSSTASLAHELVHAYFDVVIGDEGALLEPAADYLERAHPVLHGEVVGDLYQRLGREDRAEESLAFIAGAIAARQTKTVSTQRLLENRGNLEISEAILYSDIGLLVQFGLLPPCMLPPEGASGEIPQSYYEEADAACRE